MHLVDNEYPFYLKIQGENTQQWFEGDFTAKCILTNEELVDVAIRVDRYNQGRNLPAQYALLNRCVAELEVRMQRDKAGKLQAPTWWIESDHGRLLRDPNVVYGVFNEAMKAVEAYKKRLEAKADESEKTAEAAPKAKPKKEKQAEA